MSQPIWKTDFVSDISQKNRYIYVKLLLELSKLLNIELPTRNFLGTYFPLNASFATPPSVFVWMKKRFKFVCILCINSHTLLINFNSSKHAKLKYNFQSWIKNVTFVSMSLLFEGLVEIKYCVSFIIKIIEEFSPKLVSNIERI